MIDLIYFIIIFTCFVIISGSAVCELGILYQKAARWTRRPIGRRRRMLADNDDNDDAEDDVEDDDDDDDGQQRKLKKQKKRKNGKDVVSHVIFTCDIITMLCSLCCNAVVLVTDI